MNEQNKYLWNLKRDYDSCQCPQWDDPATLGTLDKIVYEIRLGRLSLSEFYSFVDTSLDHGEFASGCLRYVRRNT